MNSLVLMFVFTLASATQEKTAEKSSRPFTHNICLVSSQANSREITNEFLRKVEDNGKKVQENGKDVQEVLEKFDALEKKVLSSRNPLSCQANSTTEMMNELVKKVDALEKEFVPALNSASHQTNATNVLMSELVNTVQDNGNKIDALGKRLSTSRNNSVSCQANSTTEMMRELIKKVDTLEKKLVPPQVVGKDCAELYKKGYEEDGVYTINPDGMEEFQVYCDQTTTGGGWVIFQRRLDGSVDFYRGWRDYRNGFGNVRGEYWLGLEKINRLTRQGSYRLRVDLQDTSGNWRYAEYQNFSVLGEQTNYRLSIGTYNGTAGDALTDWHNNSPFTTKDSDHDGWSGGNCARQYKGAWWYNYCHQSNLNGVYHYGSHSSLADGINWKHWKGYYYSLKRTEMKTRPMSY